MELLLIMKIISGCINFLQDNFLLKYSCGGLLSLRAAGSGMVLWLVTVGRADSALPCI